jgi:hypothetical protein
MNILDSRILLKRSTTAGVIPTVPASNNHTDGTWVATDIYEGEAFLNTADARLFTRTGSAIKEIGLQNSLIGTYQYAQRTLTSAQILALGTTPITLIAAPGSGNVIIANKVYCRLNYNTVTYTNRNLFIKLNGANNDVAGGSSIIGSSLTRITQLTSSNDNLNTASDLTLIENASLIAYLNLNPTTGNSTMDILVEYQILDFNSIF